MSSLVVIAFDRLYCIVKPIKYWTCNRSIAVVICLVNWIIYILISITVILTKKELSVIAFPTFTTLLILISVYIYIYIYIRKNNESVHNTNTVRKKQERNLLILLCSVVVAFMISFLPISVHTLYGEDSDIPLTILFCNSLMNPVIYLTITRRKIYNALKNTLPSCCNNNATGSPTYTDTRC